MPGFDGTGPAGMGPMTGRGMGFCAMPVSQRSPAPMPTYAPAPQYTFAPQQRPAPVYMPMPPVYGPLRPGFFPGRGRGRGGRRGRGRW